MRIDKWLFHVRFYKSRRQASQDCETGIIRLTNHSQQTFVVTKPTTLVEPGFVITFRSPRGLRVIRILGVPPQLLSPVQALRVYEVIEEYELPALDRRPEMTMNSSSLSA